MEQTQQELEVKKLADRVEVKRQQLNNLKQKLLDNSHVATELELNNLCQLQKELTYLEQQQSQIMETRVLQVELPRF